jgi:hypothetical protein
MFVRACVKQSGLERPARTGDGIMANVLINSYATDAILTVTIPQVMGGVLQVTGLTAGRVFTTPTAADLLAAMADMDIGDTYMFKVSVTTAFAITWGAGAGVTLAGRATTPASSSTDIVIEKLSATTVKWTVL